MQQRREHTTSMTSPKKILYVCNSAGALEAFRMPLLKVAVESGYNVECICGNGGDATHYVEKLEAAGFTVHIIDKLESPGLDPISIFQQAKAIRKVVRAFEPEILHSFTHRANVASFLALLRIKHVRFIPNITGAGRLFEKGASLKVRLSREMLLLCYRFMGARCDSIFFQNEDDLIEIGGRIPIKSSRVRKTNGSGLDPELITVRPGSDQSELRAELLSGFGIAANKRIFVFPARALNSKGVSEFYAAASRYLELFDDAVFVHAGLHGDDDHYGLGRDTLIAMQQPGLHFIGHRRDIYSLLDASSVVVLPSTYREGVPRSLIEALYFRNIIITTDAPGCRDTVIEGWNGYLINAKSTSSLLAAMVASQKMDQDQAAINSQRLFDARFHARRITSVYLDQYRATMGGK